MEKEDIQEAPEVQLEEESTSQETDNEEVVKTEEESELESEVVEETSEETSVEDGAKIKKLEETNRQLHARLKRTEKKTNKKSEDSRVDNLDLMEFFAQGGSKDDFKEIEAIMSGKDLTFEEAQKDSLYIAYQEKKKADKAEEDSQVNSRRVVASGSNFKAGMTDEEHKLAWKKSLK